MCMAYTVILLWLVDERRSSSVEEEHVECRHQRITDAVVDENVDIHWIRKYFTRDAWLLVEQVLKKTQAEVDDLDF